MTNIFLSHAIAKQGLNNLAAHRHTHHVTAISATNGNYPKTRMNQFRFGDSGKLIFRVT